MKKKWASIFNTWKKEQYRMGYKAKYLLESGSCLVIFKSNHFHEAMWAEKTASEMEQCAGIQAQ